MRSFVIRLGALAAASLFALSASGATRAGAAAEPYVIGAILSLSGPGSTLGRPEADSMEMAVDEINKAGGIGGHPIALTILDDQSDATTAVNDLRQLVDKHAIAIFGTPLTPTSLAIAPLAEQAHVPLVSYASSVSVVTPVAQHQWIFKIPINDTDVARSMQAFMKKRNQTKVSFIYRNDDYGKTGMAHFEEVGKSAGFDVISGDAIAPSASDATTQLTHVKAANPQALICWTTLPSANVIIKGYRELGLQVPIYYSDGAATGVFAKQAGAALNGAFIATMKVNVYQELPSSDPQKKLLERYVPDFEKAYPTDAPASIFGTWGYDGVAFLKAALGRVKGTATAASLRDAMEHTTFVGVSGTFRFSPAQHWGLSEDAVLMAQIENAQFRMAK
jgi:branched-chain amino acid transport system substrate-binding protein